MVDRCPLIVQILFMLHKKLCEEKDQKDLGKLGGLEGGKSQVDPAGGAVDFLSDYKNKAKRDDGDAVDQPVKVKDPLVIHQRNYQHGHKSDDHADDLSALVNVPCAAYHQDAQYGQCQDQEHQGKFIIF